MTNQPFTKTGGSSNYGNLSSCGKEHKGGMPYTKAHKLKSDEYEQYKARKKAEKDKALGGDYQARQKANDKFNAEAKAKADAYKASDKGKADLAKSNAIKPSKAQTAGYNPTLGERYQRARSEAFSPADKSDYDKKGQYIRNQ